MFSISRSDNQVEPPARAHARRRPASLHRGELTILTPDIAFLQCADRAAAVYASAPPYVAYRVTTRVSVPSMSREREVLRDVIVRTSDDEAVIQDLPNGGRQIGHAFPIIPTFDALSYYTFSWHAGAHESISAYVTNVRPVTSTSPLPGVAPARADAVVVRSRLYDVRYAPDSSDAPNGQTHLLLTPYEFYRKQTGFAFSEIVIDNATGLPVRVTSTGPDDRTFTVDYATVDGHWVVRHVVYEETYFAPLRIGRIHFRGEATYDQFSFPTAGSDPRLSLLPQPAAPTANAAPQTFSAQR